ncbi:MAG: Helix-turn-helix protein [Acidobacteriota bacterium]|nr:Helix-turn-helix protein [Acidobacteriota bacterium]
MKELSLAHAVLLLIDNAPPEEIASLSVSGLARKFHVKPSYLSRSFHKYHYNTLHEYLEARTFVAFRYLVWNMQKPQVEKALKIMNITNTSHFIRRYKKWHQRTPGILCKERRLANKKSSRKFLIN